MRRAKKALIIGGGVAGPVAAMAHGARTSNSKAAGSFARVLRDLMLPILLKRVASNKSLAWMHDYHIDWDAKVA